MLQTRNDVQTAPNQVTSLQFSCVLIIYNLKNFRLHAGPNKAAKGFIFALICFFWFFYMLPNICKYKDFAWVKSVEFGL